MVQILQMTVIDYASFIIDSAFSYHLDGLNVEFLRGIFYNPLTNNASWFDDIRVNYAIVAHKPYETIEQSDIQSHSSNTTK